MDTDLPFHSLESKEERNLILEIKYCFLNYLNEIRNREVKKFKC